ncbi:MAG: hypothetical protein U0802_00380 [Candidatus Binatia bacterium]
MLVIDWTPALAPVLHAMNGLLLFSALAIAAGPVARAARAWLRTLSGPRVSIGRPALGHR